MRLLFVLSALVGAGIFVFICHVILSGTTGAFGLRLEAGLIIGLISSALLVAVLLPMDLSAHLFLSKGNYKEIWELEQTREVIVDGSNRSVICISAGTIGGALHNKRV